MPQLNNIITSQAFELIRDRVGEILIDELANQFTLSGDTSINATVYVERSKPFDHTELPAVNVYLTRGSYDGNVVAQNGEYDIGIDFAQKAPGTDDNRGDQLSAIRLHKLMGVARAILMSSKYKTLGYNPGFIQTRTIIDIAISQPDTKDAHHTIMGRMVLRVKAAELAENSTPTIAAGYDTNIKLGLTEKGYIYSGENIPVSACSVLLAGLTPDQLNTCILPNYDFSDSTVIANLSAQQILDLQSQIGGGNATLLDQDLEELAIIEAGDTYQLMIVKSLQGDHTSAQLINDDMIGGPVDAFFAQWLVERKTSVEWGAANPLIPDGVIVHEKNTNKLKIGNGTDVYNDLEYTL